MLGLAGLAEEALADVPAHIPGFTLARVAGGRSPRLVLDFLTGCEPGPWVQLFYIQTGHGVVRREETDRFAAVWDTPLLENQPNRHLEEVYRGEHRRLTVVHSLRNTMPGTWSLGRMDSAPYPIAVPRPLMPSFVKNVGLGTDIYWVAGQMWRVPAGEVTETCQLRVMVHEAVDAIEVAAHSGYPTGYLPSFAVQPQTYAPMGGISALSAHDFDFSVRHGGLTMDPCTFRARTRRGTCYSPWRYFIAAYQDDPAHYPVLTELVNCGHDVVVTLPPLGPVRAFVSRYFRPANPCLEPEPIVGLSQFLEGGRNTGIAGPFLWQQDWTVGFRSFIIVQFTDEEGELFDFIQLGAEFTSSGSGAGGPDALTGGQAPEQFP